MKIDAIIESYPDEEFLQANGFDDAIIGVSNGKLVYSIAKCIQILMNRDKISLVEAYKYFEFNVEGAYVGEKTPLWVDDSMFEIIEFET